MSDVNANIHIGIDTGQAQAELRRLQAQITAFNTSMSTMDRSAGSMLASGINATKMFNAQMIPVVDSVTRFSQALEGNKLSLGQYARTAASQLPGLGRVFRSEFDMMERVATDRVKKIQTQYIALGKTAKGVQEALAITPTGLARGHATDMAIAAQKQQIFNKLIDDGSTKMLNWGKNTQWAGRQLMVGFSIPLAALGTVAAKTFMELDKATTAFERVYGDLSTATSEMEANKAAVQTLGKEYTKYGIALKDTIDLSARVAATGATNEDLLAGTEQTLRFATLGQMDYNEALDATISLQSAFNVSSKDLGSTIDYLNAVENQTVLTIQDMAAAIPRVAPVIQGLGGDVKDLAVMMTAMREGGVSAENAANALKSGLASLINPTDRAKESMAKLGINMDAIINANRGDLLATVKAFGDALSVVDEFSQQQALEQIFGKYQYARMGALFSNIADGASQASRAMDLAGMSISELAQLSEKELGTIEESTTVKFQAALENLKISIAPLGEAFLKGLMPIMDVVTKIADAFNSLPDPIKNIIAVITGLVAGIGPVLLMTFGLIGNGIANIVKGIQWFRKRLAGIKGDASAFEYLASAELQAKGASEALEASVTSLTSNLLLQRGAVKALIAEYQRYVGAAGAAAAAGGPRGARPRLRMASGGVVPGSGNGDTVPALLTPGETVVTKEASQRYGPIIAAMNAGTLPGYAGGLDPSGSYLSGAGRVISPVGIMQPAVGGNQTAMGVNPQIFAGEIGEASFAAAGKGAVDLARRMETGARYAESAIRALDPLDDLFKLMHVEISSQLQSSSSIGEALDKSEVVIKKILSDYIKQEVLAGRMTRDQARALRVGTRLLLANEATSARAGLVRAERFDVREGAVSDVRTQTVQRSGTRGSPLTFFKRHLPNLTIREFGRRGLETPSGFGGWQRSHLRSIANTEMIPGLISPSVQGGDDAADRRAIERIARAEQSRRAAGLAAAAGPPLVEPQIAAARRAIGANSPAKEGERLSESIAEGQLLGAQKSAPTSARAGRIAAEAQISAMRAELAALRQSSGMSAKDLYKKTQSETRALDRVGREMKSAGYTQAQIDRAQRRILAGKLREARAVEAAANAAQKGAVLESQINKTKTQTLANEKKRSRAGFGGAGNRMGTIGMGLGMASMLPFMAQNEQGKFMGMDANALGMGMMGAGMALDMTSLVKFASVAGIAAKAAGALGISVGALGIALGGVTVAATAIGVGLYLWRKHVDQSARAAAELGANLGVAANAANNMAEMLGRQTPAQREQARLAGMSAEQQEQASEFQYIFDSEAGQQFINELKAATSEQRFSMIADYLKNAIATGLMDKTQAEVFGKAIALQIGDPIIGMKIGKEIKDQLVGSRGMTDIAEARSSAIDSSSAMVAVSAGTAGTEESSTVIGGSIQAIQDWSNVAALAKEEYDKGIISYSQMRDALDQATTAQNKYTDSIINALSQGDRGANMEAIKSQMIATGTMTEESWNAMIGGLESTKTRASWNPVGMPGAGGGRGVGASIPLREEEMNQLISLVISMIAQGIDPAEASRLGKEVFSDPELKKKFKDTVDDVGYTAAAQIQASTTGMINVDEASELAYKESSASGASLAQNTMEAYAAAERADKNNALMLDVKLNYASLNKDVTELDAYLAQFDNQELFRITPKLKEMSAEDLTKWVSNGLKMQQYVNEELAKEIESSSDYTATGREADAIEEASKIWKGEDLEKIIRVILKTEPPDLDARLSQLTMYAENIMDLPEAAQLRLGIDMTDPEELAKFGPMADQIALMWPILKSLDPNIDLKASIEAGLLMNKNDDEGGYKSAKDLAKDVADLDKAFKKFGKADTLKAKKKIITEFAMESEGMTPEQVDERWSALEDRFGKQKIANMPTDVFFKAWSIQGQITADQGQLDKLLNTYNSMTVEQQTSAAGAALWGQIKSMQAAIAGGEIELEQIGARTPSSAPSGDGGGSGGSSGQEKENPFLDFKKSIVDQIRMYADAGIKLKDLMKAKNGFFNLLQANSGIDDKIRAAGLPPALAEYLMGLDPKDAAKVLRKLTGKNGDKLINRYMAGQVSQRMSEAQTTLGNYGVQRAALASLSGRRNVPAEALESIAGDPNAAAEYLTILENIQRLREKRDKFKVGTDEWEKVNKQLKEAKQTLQEFIDLQVQSAREAAAFATEMEMEQRVANANVMPGMISAAQSAGMSPSVMAAVTSGDYTAMYQQRMSAPAKAREELKAAKAELAEAKKKGDKEAIAAAEERLAKAEQSLADARQARRDVWVDIATDVALKEQEAYMNDPEGYLMDKAQESFDAISAQFDQMFLDLEDKSETGFQQAWGMSKEGAQELIENNEIIIKQYQDQISILENKNEMDNLEVRGLERKKKQWTDLIDRAQEYIDQQQEIIDGYQRSIDLNNHQMDLLNHDLDLIGQAENKINEAYDKRIEALDEVTKLNDHVIAQQQNQLNLAQAISTGDVYSAAQARAQMEQQNVSYGTEMARSGLEQARRNQISGLVNAQGLTRDQIEERVADYQERNYQLGQLIYAVEENIYAKNQEILGYKKSIAVVDNDISVITDRIWEREGQILEIQKLQQPYIHDNELWGNRLSTSEKLLEDAKSDAVIGGLTLKQHEMINKRLQTQLKAQDASNKLSKEQLDTWIKIAGAIGAAQAAMQGNLAAVEQGRLDALRPINGTPIDISTFFDAETGEYDIQGLQDFIRKVGTEAMSTLLAEGVGSFIPANAAGAEASNDNATNGKLGPNEWDIAVTEQDSKGRRRFKSNGALVTGRLVNMSTLTSRKFENGVYVEGSTIGVPEYGAQYAAGGPVRGSGSRDSIPAMLSPGEFIMRRAAVQKYGLSTFEKMNMGSFSVPRYNMPKAATPTVAANNNIASISAPVYNTYSINVPVTQPNATADEIANKVITRIRSVEDRSIRRINGY